MSSKAVLLFVAALVSTSSVFASELCANYYNSALIITKVTSVKSLDRYTCVVNVTENSTRYYKEDERCPLDKMEVIDKGIDVGLKNFGDCTYQAGDEISGVLSKDENGSILFNAEN